MNLLLISVDSLRLDFAPGFSNRVHTPRFSELTQDFHHLEQCFSVSSATRPVHTSLFTGLYPFEHGIEGQQSPAMREGVANLFDLSKEAGYAVFGHSEAPEIFTGLNYADQISVYPSNPNKLLELVRNCGQTLLFLHYWSVHAPYGTADGLAFGEMGRLVASGRLDLVQSYYCSAIEKLFEFHIAPLLASLDLGAWTIFIISDHGESWRPEEPYHGQTLRNDVLRVPLYYHLPSIQNKPPARDLISLVDLFPTFVSLLELDYPYRGFARDIWSPTTPQYYLAEIDPGPMGDDRSPPNTLFPPPQYGRQWSLFNSDCKFSYDEKTHSEELVETWSETPIFDLSSKNLYHQAYAELKAKSRFSDADFSPGAERDLLQERLKKLGYLA